MELYVVTRNDINECYDELVGVYSNKTMAICAINKDYCLLTGTDPETFDGVTWDGDGPAIDYYNSIMYSDNYWKIECTTLDATF